MGLISVASSSVRGALQDVWRDYFYMDSIPDDTLIIRAECKSGKRSRNKDSNNIISNGSIIAVNDGQCAIITYNGLIQEICSEPGEFVYSQSSEPSMLCEDFIADTLATIKRRFVFGGNAAKEYRVYYINTKEILCTQFGTMNPIPFRVVDQKAGIDIDVRLKICGSFTFRVTNPVTLYQNVAGNVESSFKTEQISKQLKYEFLASLGTALSFVSQKGVRYSELMLHANDMEVECYDILKETWEDERGVKLCNISLASVIPLDEDIEMVQQLQRGAIFTDQRLANANMMSAQMDALRGAANNSAGAITGFMGMNMAMNNIHGYQQPMYQQSMYQQPMYQQPAQVQDAPIRDMNAGEWVCSCGYKISTDFAFCPKCGSKRLGR